MSSASLKVIQLDYRPKVIDLPICGSVSFDVYFKISVSGIDLYKFDLSKYGQFVDIATIDVSFYDL